MISNPNLETQIEGALQADRHRLRGRLRSIRRAEQAGKPTDRNLQQFAAELQRSVALRAARLAAVPRVPFDHELPIAARRDEIAAAIRDHQVVVVCGETGSGKSTQLPKICLTLGRGVDGLIGHTQPRRIAARSVAARIAEELGTPLGQDVGYKIRFSDATNPRTYVKLMTDGILLAESQHDRFLNQYDTLIIDEAHERSLNIDFILGYLKRLLPKRPDLKVIVTSATIDAERFAWFFGASDQPAPVIAVSGRTYPVEVYYRPPGEATAARAAANLAHNANDVSNSSDAEGDVQAAVLEAVDELARIDHGDMLIFMPTEQDIHATAKALRGRSLPGDLPSRMTEIVPLYARLPGPEQQKVFQPHAYRRIVITTNVAESSLTVPGIRYVIDTGTARIRRYSARTKVQRLPIEPVSRASADQRLGRCGRVGPGICVRLYSEQDYAERERFTPPEIQRSNLASVILRAKTLGLGEIEEFPFLDQPRPESLRDGYNTLFELGAIDEQQQLTELGRGLGRIPVDPRIGRIILAAAEENCLHEILIIAAALESQDPRDRPHGHHEAADEAHAQFADEQSDFMGYLKLWDFVREMRMQLSRGKFQKACRDHFLSFSRVREWQEVHRQLVRITAAAGLRQQARRDDSSAIHRALLTGFLSNVAQRTGGKTNEYFVAGGQRAWLWPGCGAIGRPPKWLMASEVVETSRRYLRTAAGIQRAWIEELAPHLLRRSYHDPHWDPTQGAAMVFTNVSLFGLRIVHRRRVRLAATNPQHARDLFLFQGLVRGGYSTRAKFLTHNQELLRQLEELQRRSRQQGILRGEDARFDFYAARIGPDVVDGRSFELFRRRVEQAEPRRLYMAEADLLHAGHEKLDAADYPDALFVRSMRLPLGYCFEPGSERDGVTVSVPREGFQQLDPKRLDWLVPGLLDEKVVALIKSLSKNVRRKLIPAAETAGRVVAEIGYGNGSFAWGVARALSRIAGESIPPEAFGWDRLPNHLRMRVRVVDAEGRTLAVGRDMAELRRRLWAAGHETPAVYDVYLDGVRWNREGITSWDFGELPDEIELPEEHITLVGFPAVVDRHDSVSLELMPAPELAQRESRAGIRRLFVLATAAELRTQVEWLPNLRQILLDGASLAYGDGTAGSGAAVDPMTLRNQLGELIADRAFFPDETLPRTEAEFAERLARGRDGLGLAVQELVEFVGLMFRSYGRARAALSAAVNPQWKYAVTDMGRQLDELTRPGFLTSTPRTWLAQLPRYLQAIECRLEQLAAGELETDEQRFALIHPRWQNCLELLADECIERRFDPELHHFRWLLEEYRVWLFAPRLGTAAAVSEQRLEAQWDRVGHGD